MYVFSSDADTYWYMSRYVHYVSSPKCIRIKDVKKLDEILITVHLQSQPHNYTNLNFLNTLSHKQFEISIFVYFHRIILSIHLRFSIYLAVLFDLFKFTFFVRYLLVLLFYCVTVWIFKKWQIVLKNPPDQLKSFWIVTDRRNTHVHKNLPSTSSSNPYVLFIYLIVYTHMYTQACARVFDMLWCLLTRCKFSLITHWLYTYWMKECWSCHTQKFIKFDFTLYVLLQWIRQYRPISMWSVWLWSQLHCYLMLLLEMCRKRRCVNIVPTMSKWCSIPMELDSFIC